LKPPSTLRGGGWILPSPVRLPPNYAHPPIPHPSLSRGMWASQMQIRNSDGSENVQEGKEGWRWRSGRPWWCRQGASQEQAATIVVACSCLSFPSYPSLTTFPNAEVAVTAMTIRVRTAHRQRGQQWHFDPISASTTSLTCKSESEVGFRRFQPHSCPHHLPCMQERAGGVFTMFTHHLPRVQERAGGCFVTMFRRCSPRHHLPRMQERDGGGFHDISTLFTPPPPPLHARVSRRQVLRCFNTIQAATTSPRMKQRDGGRFLWHFHAVHAATTSLPRMQRRDGHSRCSSTSLACKCEPEVVFYDVSTLFTLPPPPSPPPPSHARASQR